MGGRVMFDDMQDTPNVLMAMFEFPNPQGSGDKKKILQFEVRHWDHNPEGLIDKVDKGPNQYMTSDANTVGNLFYGSQGYMSKTLDRWQVFNGPDRQPGDSGGGIGNHFQNFIDAIRAGDQKLAKADIEGGVHTCALIHFANISYRLGRSLVFDPVTMRFVGDDQANAMLTKSYRQPYAIPEPV